MAKTEIRLSGSGGQGVIMATIILAEAAFQDKKQAVQCQSYGPEARGGLCKAECIISDKPIAYPKIETPTFLLSLTQASLDKYVKTLKNDAIVMVDSSLEVPDEIRYTHKVIALPILDSARNVIKNPMSANIIAVGAVNEVLKVASYDAIKKAVLNHIPKGSEDQNLEALDLGKSLIKKA